MDNTFNNRTENLPQFEGDDANSVITLGGIVHKVTDKTLCSLSEERKRKVEEFFSSGNSRKRTKKFVSFKRKNSSSIYKGVVYVKANKKWRSQICYNGKKLYVGSYITEFEAAIARDRKIHKLFGNCIQLLNFPTNYIQGFNIQPIPNNQHQHQHQTQHYNINKDGEELKLRTTNTNDFVDLFDVYSYHESSTSSSNNSNSD